MGGENNDERGTTRREVPLSLSRCLFYHRHTMELVSRRHPEIPNPKIDVERLRTSERPETMIRKVMRKLLDAFQVQIVAGP